MGEPLPDARTAERLGQARRGGVGIPRESLRGLPDEVRTRLHEKPFVILDHPDAGLARLARTEAPRLPRGIVAALVHALSHDAPLVLFGREASRAAAPLVAHVVARPGPTVDSAVRAELGTILKSGGAAVQDSKKLIARTGQAFVDLSRERARQRTLSGLLERLVDYRRRWSAQDAADRYRTIGEAASLDEGPTANPGDPFALAYLDLLPLLIARMGPTADLSVVFERPMAHLALGLVPTVVIEA